MNVWIVYYILTLSTLAEADIKEGPKDGIFAAGSNVTLLCIIEGQTTSTAWTDKISGKILFYNEEKAVAGEKYSNFYLASSDYTDYTDYSLNIIDADVTDDGSYSCQADDEIQTAIISIEAPPTLHLSIIVTPMGKGNDELKQSSTQMVAIKCIAIGAKPAVKLRISVNEGTWMEELENNITQRDLLFDSFMTHDYSLSNIDESVTCQAYGQISIRPTNITKRLYAPTCNISLEAQDVVCNCDAFPPVYKYVILVNGEDAKEVNKINVGGYSSGNFICIGTSILGSNESQTLSISDRNEFGKNPLPIIISALIVVIIIVVLTALFFRRRHSKFSYTGIRIPAITDPNVKEKISKGVYGIFWNIANEIEYDIEIFAIENLNLEKDQIEKIVDDNNTFEDKVQAIFEYWVINSGQNVSTNVLRSISARSDVCMENNFGGRSKVTACFTKCSISAPPSYKLSLREDQMCTDEMSLPLRSPPFLCFLEGLAAYIGKAGMARLQKQYNVANDCNSSAPCSNVDLLREMVRNKLLDNTIASLEGLKDCLKDLNLLSAAKETGDYILSELKKLIMKVGAMIKVDWEILAMEDLKLTKDDVLAIIKEENNNEDQVMRAFAKWSEYQERKDSDGNLIHILRESHVCLDFQCNNCSEIWKTLGLALPFDEGHTKVILHDEPIEPREGITKSENVSVTVKCPREVFLMFEPAGSLIGNTGALKLAEVYLTSWASTCYFNPGKLILARLAESESLKDNLESVKRFRESLSKCHLFRALGAVDECLRKDLQDFINIVSQRLPCDWEIFAIKSLGLEKSDVQSVVKTEAANDQVKRVLNNWAQSNDMWCSKYNLQTIMLKSNVCTDPYNDCLEIINVSPNSKVLQSTINPKTKAISGINKEYSPLRDLECKEPNCLECFRDAFVSILGKILGKSVPLNNDLIAYQNEKTGNKGMTETEKFILIEKRGIISLELVEMFNEAKKQEAILNKTLTDYRLHKTVQSSTGGTKTEKTINERSALKFYMMLWHIAQLVGREGTAKISKTFKLKREALIYGKVFGRPLCLPLALLISERRLGNQEPSLKGFQKVLEECGLFRAMEVIDEYVKETFSHSSKN